MEGAAPLNDGRRSDLRCRERRANAAVTSSSLSARAQTCMNCKDAMGLHPALTGLEGSSSRLGLRPALAGC